MFTTVPELISSAGNSAWVIAMWPNRLTSNCLRHCAIGSVSTGAVDRDPGVVDQRANGTTQRIARDALGDRGHVRFDGDVEDARFDAIVAQRIGVDLAAYPGKHVKTLVCEFSSGGCAHSRRSAGDDDQLVTVGAIRGIHGGLHRVVRFELTLSTETMHLS